MGLKTDKPRRWLYVAIVLNDYSRDLLLQRNIVPSDWKTGCDHITLCHNDRSREAKETFDKLVPFIGKFVCANATGVGAESDADGLTGLFALKVDLPESIPCRNAAPHVTLGWRPPMKPRQSNDITEWVTISSPITLMGRIRIIYETTDAMPKKLYFTLDLHHLRIDDYKEDDGYLEVMTNAPDNNEEIPMSLSVSRNEDDEDYKKEEFIGQADLVIKDGRLVAKLPSTLKGLRSACKKTKSALKEFCIDFLKNLLATNKVSSFDFSRITDDEFVEDNYANKIQIDRWTRHNIWYTVYPYSYSLKDGKLSFLCRDDEDGRDETVPQNDFTADDLACLVDVLKYYLSDFNPDWSMEIEGETASLTYTGE